MSGLATRKWLQLCSALCLFQYISCYCYLPELNFLNGNIRQPPLYEDENGTFVEELSVIQFTCSDGYIRIGMEYIQCVFEKWSDKVPFCAGLRCSDPPEVEHATFETRSLTADLKVGSFVDYTCNEGYLLKNENASTLQCFLKNDSDTAVWGGEMPRCMAKTNCSDPGKPKNGGRVTKNGRSCCMSGTILKFYCESPNYELVGAEEIQCRLSGKWSTNRPICKPLYGFCEPPPARPNGVISEGDYFEQGEKVRLVCDEGYKIEGSSDSNCLGESWDKELGTCEEIVCPAPEPIEHGTISELKENNDTIFKFKSEINYACDKGYRIRSKYRRRVCGRRGWSGDKPYCVVVKCPNPGRPENGQKHGYNNSVGGEISFSCMEEYELLGSTVRRCLPNGQWDGQLARCNIKSNYCPNPGTPISGSKNRTEYEKGDKVRFRCAPGHILLGSNVRECLPNKTWSGTETICLSKYDYDDEKVVSSILQGVLAEKMAYQEEELEKYYKAVQATTDNRTIASGRFLNLNFNGRIIIYFAFDVSGSVGKPNFKKSIEFAKAIVRKVGISDKGALAGALTFSSKAEIIFWPMTFTKTEQVVDALDRVNFTGGGTAASLALKSIREKHLPLVRENVNGKLKHVLFVLTDGKANMGGDPAPEANKLKEEGVEIFCIGITGEEDQKNLYAIASSSEYGHDHKMRPNVFILQNYETLAWLVHEITNGTVGYSECGLNVDTVGLKKSKILGGEESSKPWPWMAALYMDVGNERPRKYSFQCGGSIIHQRYILTAAHCLFDLQNKLRKPEEVIVKLGLTNIRNKTFLQEYKVQSIIKHEHYGATPFDSDIALLELASPINFTAYVRPICLPPKEKGKLYTPESIAWAIGWGEQKSRNKTEKTGLPVMSKILKEIQLPIRTREVCSASLADEDPPLHKDFTPRMFCAGGGGKEDTCSGDSGGPVMQSAVNKDGYPIWIQVGIISWGLGCGLEYEYGFYSHVQELMPWIEKNIKNL